MRIVRFVAVPVLMAVVVLSNARAAEKADDGGWTTDYAKALETAKKENKAVLLDFTGSDWCGWCKKLKAEVFDKKEFKDWAAKNAVLVEVDFPQAKKLAAEVKKQNDELAKKFPVEGYPTIVVLGPDGKKLGQLGYEQGGPGAWTKAADAILKKK